MPESNVPQWKRPTGSQSRNSVAPQRRSAVNREALPTQPRANAGPVKKKSWGKRIGFTVLGLVFAMVLLGAGAFLWLYQTTSVPNPSEFALAQTTTVYYSDAETEIGSFSEVNRTIIDAGTLPDYVGNAVVSSEDRSFYTNAGVDLKGIFRALINNLMGNPRQGASTITQGYVENYYVGEATTSYIGKAREAIMALKIARTQEKPQILGAYLNTVYFGRGTYGIEAASLAYFGHPASEMTISESALLAGILPSPSGWDPAVDLEQAQSRWARVLTLMVEDGWISEAESEAAVFPTTLELTDTLSSMTGVKGYLLEQVRGELLNTGIVTAEQIDAGGLRITTTIDQKMQQAAQDAVNVMPQDTPAELGIALSSIDNATGEILAEYPGKDYQVIQFNGVTQAVAMAGSTLKPFALLTYIEQGGSVYDTFDGSSPQDFQGRELNNNDYVSFGKVNLVKATQYSINTAYVALNEEVGPDATLQTMIKAGLPETTVGLESNLFNVLGSASPHNIDLAVAYATMANGGERVTAHIVREVLDSTDSIIYQATAVRERVFSAEDVSGAMPALESVVDEGGTGEKVVELGRSIGGKTGTSDEQKSAQFVAFTPQITTAVSMYIADENGTTISLPNIGGLSQFHGSDWPVDVWLAYMQVATQDMPNTDFEWYTPPKKQTGHNSTPSETATPEGTPSAEPTVAPTVTPTVAPTVAPTVQPTPTVEPTVQPTPTVEPTVEPTPTPSPSGTP